jgi:large subunit ribosomal protein L10
MDKQQKTKRVEHYTEVIEGAGYAILAEFGKMDVGTVMKFRRELIETGCSCIVLKNTLAKIAFEKNELQEVCEFLVGPSMLFYGSEEIAPAAKIIARYGKQYPALKVKTILYDNTVFPKEQFSSFTSLPTKDEVRAALLRVIKAPQSQFVQVINAASRLVGVLRAFADKQAG